MHIQESDHAHAAQIPAGDSYEALSTERLPAMERRSRDRLPIELPLEISAVDGETVGWTAMTLDISMSGGVRFECPHPLRAGQHIQYIVTLSQGSMPVRISCQGRVLRCHPSRRPSFWL